MSKKASNLQTAILERRDRAEMLSSYKCRWAPALSDPKVSEALAQLLSNDIAIALGNQLEDLETSRHEFKRALLRVFMRVLTMARQRDEVVLFFNEAIPGYTLMILKKGVTPEPVTPKKSKGKVAKEESASDGFDPQGSHLESSPEGQAAALMIESFFDRTSSQALTIEHPDALFVFFPATDFKRNVRDLGFYSLDA